MNKAFLCATNAVINYVSEGGGGYTVYIIV